LLKSVLSCAPPLKWSFIAECVPNRTGKQCRERYYNHLQPAVNHAEWTPVEDARLCHLHSILGACWAAIAVLFPGRTNNNVKNRFHMIRRRLEKDVLALDQTFLATASSTKIRVMERLANYSSSRASEITADVIKVLVNSLRKQIPLEGIQYNFTFDPVRCENEDPCKRCGLLIPSPQTGTVVCKKTGWCSSCFSAPAFLSGDVLRIAHSERNASAAVGI